MKKRIISALLFCSMLLTMGLAACSDDEKDTSSASVVSETVSKDTGNEESVEENNYLVPHLGERDLGGFTLSIISCEPEGIYNKAQFAPEEEIGEPINDAAYNRNELIKAYYNCDITVQFIESLRTFPTKIENDVLSGVNDYNACITGVQALGLTAANGWFYDLNDLPESNFALDQPWWDQTANASMTLCNKLYFASGDISVSDDINTMCIFFNKDIVTDKGLEDPYQLVYDGKWTIDAMHRMCLGAASAGGDGVMNMAGDDTWGFVGASFDTYKLVIGAGCPQIERDKNGDPIIAMSNERNVNAFNRAQEFMRDGSCVAYVEKWYRWDDYANNYFLKEHFFLGQALFISDDIALVGSAKMLASDFNYGVLPTPKLDEEQDDYICAIDPYRFYAVSLPKTTEMDIDKTTFVLEAMAYLSRDQVTPKFYEVTLKEKRFHDDDAPKMLDIIFANRCVDLSIIYNWNDCIQYYNRLLPSNQGVLAYMQANGGAMQAAMEECIEKIKSYPNY